ncbi:PEP/pyruvate-binding domain-containing protein [Thermosulfuriphilus sp.]
MGLFERISAFFRPKKPAKERLPIRVVFSRFREVIDSNTRALEIIADMGDKLSGDYIFDMAYIRRTTEELSEAVFHSIHSLNMLCDNRYSSLYEIFEQIDGRIRALVEGREEETPLVVALRDIGPEMSDAVGGKMAHLAEIRRHLGLRVPEGFVITATAYRRFIRTAGLEPLVEGLRKALEAGEEGQIEASRRQLVEAILEAEPDPDLLKAMAEALEAYRLHRGARPLVIRSSAQEEDLDFSFAGQFETIVNVLPEVQTLSGAYKKVVASLFGEKAVAYARRSGIPICDMAMAVGCLELIVPRASGVMFTLNPQDLRLETILISSTWGLGVAVVEGRFPTDRFLVSRTDPEQIVAREIAEKDRCILPAREGIVESDVPPDFRQRPSLSDVELKSLARLALTLERYFKRPQDVEWAIGEDGQLYVLQSRPLRFDQKILEVKDLPALKEKYELVIEGRGEVAQGGIASGPVFIIERLEDLDRFPEGAILVARRDSSHFVRVMPKASAILTDIGSPTSHMATLCREFRIPAIVGMEDITQLVRQGEVITVDADDHCIYRGRVEELLKFQAASQLDLFETKEFRLLKKILRYVAPLNLIDPLVRDFRPEACKTFHDLLRFCHEMAVQELINVGREEATLLDKSLTKKLEIGIPTGILVIDLGGGLRGEAEDKEAVGLEDIDCLPFRAVLEGMLEPGVWQTQAVQMKMRDFLSSMLKTPELEAPRYVGDNIAVISTYYLNLSLRFGYHFNILDTYCSPAVRENHIYFRFIGGAADVVKRGRRIQLIHKILTYHDFNIVTKGDLLVARLANLPQSEIMDLLKMIGRLIGFTRQLDVLMDNDLIVEEAYQKFLARDYDLFGVTKEH